MAPRSRHRGSSSSLAPGPNSSRSSSSSVSSRQGPSSVDGSTSVKSCQMCRKHRKLEPKKGHKEKCSYNKKEHYDQCQMCFKVHLQQIYMKETTSLRRSMPRNGETILPKYLEDAQKLSSKEPDFNLLDVIQGVQFDQTQVNSFIRDAPELVQILDLFIQSKPELIDEILETLVRLEVELHMSFFTKQGDEIKEDVVEEDTIDTFKECSQQVRRYWPESSSGFEDKSR